METPITTAILGGGALVIVAIVSLVGVLVRNRGDRLTARESALDARDKATLARLDTELAALTTRVTDLTDDNEEMKRQVEQANARAAATARVFRQIADQLHDFIPNLDPADLAVIEDTIPPQWIRKKETP